MRGWFFWVATFFTAAGLFLVSAAAINRLTMDRLFSVQERLLTLLIALVFGATVCWMVRKKIKERERVQR